MTRQALLVLPLLVALFAGCTGVGGATALGLRSVADGAAADWDSNAQLVSVFGLEANITLPPAAREAIREQAQKQADTNPEAILAILSDPAVGDGVAPGWGYAYLSSKGVYGVLVGADRSILYSKQVANSTEAESGMAQIEKSGIDLRAALNAWTIDSDKASANLAAANSTFAQQVGKPNQVATWFLNPEDRTWNVLLAPAKGRGVSLMASVSYEDGTVKSVRVMGARNLNINGVNVDVPDQSASKPAAQAPKIKQEAGTVQGTVSTLSNTDSGSFDISKVHKDGVLVFSARDSAAGTGLGTITITVTDPNGMEYRQTLTPTFGSQQKSLPFDPTTGDWKVQMVSSGVTLGLDGTVAWCTDGVPTADSSQNEACQQLSTEGTASSASLSAWLPFAAAP